MRTVSQPTILWIATALSPQASRVVRELREFDVQLVSAAAEIPARAAALDDGSIVVSLPFEGASSIELLESIRRANDQVPIVVHDATGELADSSRLVQHGEFYCIFGAPQPEAVARVVRALVQYRPNSQLNRLAAAVETEAVRDPWRANLIGECEAMRPLLDLVSRIAPRQSTVLITGETGTGKEVVARAIHAASNRADQAMVAVNCSALPETLIEAELFGHVKGAFTGATGPRTGRFEQAHRGTIFLDEIAEMSPTLQAKLLRVIQEREFQRVGGNETIAVDVRIIASTNRNLEAAVRDGDFRGDLYYRINVVPIILPPLRERSEDILLLANHFLQRYCQRNRKAIQGFASDAQRKLLAYNWPGNVRELENAIERAVVMAQGDAIGADAIALNPDISREGLDDVASKLLHPGFSIEEFERELLEAGLRKTGGNQSRAAELLGLTRRTLQYRMEKYNIQVERAQAPPPNNSNHTT